VTPQQQNLMFRPGLIAHYSHVFGKRPSEQQILAGLEFMVANPHDDTRVYSPLSPVSSLAQAMWNAREVIL
jgi:hypothetical protein